MNKVAVFTGLYPPAVNGGGPIRSTEALVVDSPSDIIPIVVTSNYDLGAHEPMSISSDIWLQRGRSLVRYTSQKSLVKLFQSFKAVQQEAPDLLHFNGFFNSRFTIYPLLVWRLGFWRKARILVAPRGEFGSGALVRHSLRKSLYIAFFRFFGLHRSIVWHSTATHESDDIRRIWGETAQIIFRENHTLLPPEPLYVSKNLEEIAHFVFLGRIVEHKGLAILLESLMKTKLEISLDIYGPEEDITYVKECKKLQAALPENVRVSFRGAVSPEDVRSTLSKYDALLMPTAGENFGHVIAESLSVSCPVIATRFTPWNSTLQNGGGVIVPNRDPEKWFTEIEKIAVLSAESRTALRRKAGDAYRVWRAQPQKPHVWTLALDL